jgi:hypothetical protein
MMGRSTIEMKSISLRDQIEELEYELSMRRAVYARLDRAEPRGKAAREEHMARMKAAKETLEQLARGRTASAPAANPESQS